MADNMQHRQMSNASKELLYLLRTVDEWDEPHGERHLVSIPGNVRLLDLHLQLPHDVNAHAFSKYVGAYVRGRSLMATRDPIVSPFLPKQTTLDHKESLEVFRLILQYASADGLTERRRRVVANLIVQKGISNDALRDEILVQLVNQTVYSGAAFDGAASYAWVLLTGCLSAFQPSQNLAKHLLKYVSDAANSRGYGIVCQQKLLQGLSTGASSPRSYPPCVLEWTAARLKACAALPCSFADGVTLKGQVESWTTAEQFASNLLQSRRASSGFTHGWTVVLKDDRDAYECPGHGFVLDLVGEIEVVPSFPCGVAFFLVSSDLSRPATRQDATRDRWSNQPHNAHRLRLMPLEVDELPDSSNPPRNLPPPPVSPRSSSLAPSTPSSPASSPREVPQSSNVNSPDLYASRDEALSQVSALNKRPEKLPGIISKSSALNSRYHLCSDYPSGGVQGNGGGGGGGPPVRGPRQNGGGRASPPPSRLSQVKEDDKRMEEWLENVFGEVTDENVRDLRNHVQMERRLKGGGDELTSQYSMPLGSGLGLGYGLSPYGAQGSLLPPPNFSQPLLTQPMPSVFSQPAMMTNSSLASNAYQPTFLPQSRAPVASGINSSYLYPAAASAQSQVLNQFNPHAAELHAQLQEQELEKKVLQSSIETEILKNQLHHVRGHSGSSTNRPTKDSVAKQPISARSTRYPARKTTKAAEPVEEEEEYEEEEEQEEEPEPIRVDRRPVRSTRPIPVAKPVMVPAEPKRTAKKPAAASGGRRTGSEDPPPPPQSILKNPTPAAKGVSFSNGVVDISKALNEDASSPPTSPSPPPPAPQMAQNHSSSELAKIVDDSINNGNVRTTTASKIEGPSAVGSGRTPGAAAKPQSRPVSGAIGSQRRPPVKIGHIVWPPKQPKEDDIHWPRHEPGRLSIDEVRAAEEEAIARKLNASEVERKINDKIQMAKKKSSESEEEEKLRKQPPLRKRMPLPSGEAISPQRDSVSAEVDNYHTLDMKTRQFTLERKLAMANWGTHGRKDEPPAAPLQPAAAPVPVTPPPAPPTPPSISPISPPPVQKREAKQEIYPFDLHSMDNIRTVLYAQCTDPFYTYANVQWNLEVRKEYFRPLEKFSDPDLVYLVFCQIVFDVSASHCIRLSPEDRTKMAAVIEKSNVRRNNITANHSTATMTEIIETAKTLPIYFSRIFAVNGGKRNRRLQMIAIGHSGIRLLTRTKDSYEDKIEILEHIGFQEMESVTVPKEGAIVIKTATKHAAMYSPQVNHICKMIESFRTEFNTMTPAAAKQPGN